MSRNGFNDCEREYNARQEEIEMAKDQRSEAERVGSSQPQCNTQSSDHPTTADSDTPRTDEVWGSMHGSGYQMMRLAQKLERELAEARRERDDKDKQLASCYDKLCKAESRTAAAYDLLRECLDWGLPDDLKQRIDKAMGEKK
jgi:hypothetical protein